MNNNNPNGQTWNDEPSPTFVASPYNFVPLSSQVNIPGGEISQDVPFQDGLCGWLGIELENTTPFYIRNGGPHKGKNRSDLVKDPQFTSFFQVVAGGAFAIPGASLKGVIRNVLEIVSFSRMSRVADRRYAIRDLNNKDRSLYADHMTTEASPFASKVQAGWLSFASGSWLLRPCAFARVEIGDLQAYGGCQRLGDKQPAKEKYQKWERCGKGLGISFALDKRNVWDHGCRDCNHKPRPLELKYDKATDLGRGNLTGTVVFTGQPSSYDPANRQRHRKHMEFIFYAPSGAPPESIKVDAQTMKEFEFIHSVSQESQIQGEGFKQGMENPEWKYWKDRLRRGESAPVFFLRAGAGASAPLHSMGLSMMYRLPYKHSTHSALRAATPLHLVPPDLASFRPDFAERIFGYAHQDRCCKGRVQFETLACGTPAPKPLPKVWRVLSSPKPTFYPNYIRQQPNAQGKVAAYRTFMDDQPILSGWKRYPVRPDGFQDEPPRDRVDQPNVDLESPFCPLPAATKFSGRIHFHNLRPAELGALVWVLELGGDPGLRHSVGMAKPYGYGSVRIRVVEDQCAVTGMDAGAKWDKAGWQAAFVQEMNAFCPAWEQSPQILELLAMANPKAAKAADRYRYPKLEPKNIFAEIKRNSLALLPYSGRLPSRPAAPPPGAPPPPFDPRSLTHTVVEATAGARDKKGSLTLRFAHAGQDYEGGLHWSEAQKMGKIETGQKIKVKIKAFSNKKFEFGKP